jgi:hypothetical protein
LVERRAGRVLELKVTRAGVVPDVPDDAQIWRDWSGVPRAYGYTANGHHWICLPEVAAYRFTAAGGVVEAIADAVPRHEVEDAYRRHVLPFALQALGSELLHASGVVTPSGALGFCGGSSAGKSTLAHRLASRGHEPLADDALMFEPTDTGVDAIRIPFTVRIEGRVTPLDASGSERFPLAALFVVEPAADVDPARPEVIPLPHSAAFPLLLYHAHCFSFRDERRTRLMTDRYLKLAARVPAFRLRYRRDLDRIPAVLDAVEGALA